MWKGAADMKPNKLFISPAGEQIEVEINHIATVIKNPKLFGLTKSKIVKTYKKFKEPLGLEGKARAEILIELIQKKWCRVFFDKKEQLYKIQTTKELFFDDGNDQFRNNIFKFTNEVGSDFKIIGLRPNEILYARQKL